MGYTMPPEDKQAYLRGLTKDRVFSGLDAGEQEKLLDECVGAGVRRARELRERFGFPADGDALRALARVLGVTVSLVKTKDALPFIAEYMPREQKIELYPVHIARVQAQLSEVNPAWFESRSLTEMCLAHELFHHLERRECKTTGRLVFTQVKWLGCIPVKHFFPEGSEVAAHVFVAELLELPASTYGFAAALREYYEQRKLSGQGIQSAPVAAQAQQSVYDE